MSKNWWGPVWVPMDGIKKDTQRLICEHWAVWKKWTKPKNLFSKSHWRRLRKLVIFTHWCLLLFNIRCINSCYSTAYSFSCTQLKTHLQGLLLNFTDQFSSASELLAVLLLIVQQAFVHYTNSAQKMFQQFAPPSYRDKTQTYHPKILCQVIWVPGNHVGAVGNVSQIHWVFSSRQLEKAHGSTWMEKPYIPCLRPPPVCPVIPCLIPSCFCLKPEARFFTLEIGC